MHGSQIAARRTFVIDEVRSEFPILDKQVRGHKLVYLDNAATTQKPRSVIETISRYYEATNANIHRAVHFLSEQATLEHDKARETVRAFLNAASVEEIIFTRGTTEAINLVAASYGRTVLKPGDEILITAMEHHSNIVPWQLVAEQTGATVRAIPMDDRGVLDLDAARALITPRTRIVAIVHVSNALGTVNPIQDIIRMAHENGSVVLVDGAQSVQHVATDVSELDADFFVFSGHKIYGPTGIGVLYGKKHLLDAMPPYQGGGDMIRTVTLERSTWNTLPYKFEAGTPDIAGAIALGAALDYFSQFNIAEIERHEHDLLEYATDGLMAMDGVRIIGTAPCKAGAISFVSNDVHPHDIGTFLDFDGVAIRTGHHCAQPVMDFYGVPATARVSFAMYNTRSDVDAFLTSLDKSLRILSGAGA